MYVASLGNKKQILLAKRVKEEQNMLIKGDLITKSLQRNLFNAVKKYYLFGSSQELLKISQFLSKKQGGEGIYLVLF